MTNGICSTSIRVSTILGALLGSFAVTEATAANEVTWHISGTLTTADVSGGFLAEFPAATIGSAYSLTLAFDADSPMSSQNAGANGMRYRYNNAISSVDFEIDGVPMMRNQQGFASIDIWDDYTPFGLGDPPADGFNLTWGVESTQQGGFAQLALILRGPERLDIFSGPGLPTDPSPLLTMLSTKVVQLLDQTDIVAGTVVNTARIVMPALPVVEALPDVNANGRSDQVVLREGSTIAEVRDGLSGTLLRNITFLSDAYTPVTIAALPDADNNGVSELAVLATRNSDGRIVVEIRNVTGGELPRQVWFAANHTAVGLAIVEDDADNNGIAELAVLSTRDSDGRGLVEVKNAFGATNTVALWAGAGLTATDVDVVPDADGNGVPEIAILSTRDSDGRIVAEIKNAAGATLPNAVWFAAGHTAIDLTVVDDADNNGIEEVAVLSSRDSDGRVVVEVKNASGATLPNAVWFAAGHTAQAVLPVNDADGNTVPEIAVLSSRDSDGRILVEVKNAAGATSPNPIWYSSGFGARGMAILDDADNNGVQEVGVLLIRDSDDRILVQGRNAAGNPSPNNYWYSP